MIPILYYIVLSTSLFALGIAVILTKKNLIAILIGVELILNAANINFVGFSRYDALGMQGQVMSLFVIVIAAAEASVALAIVIKLVEKYKTSNLDEINELKG